MGRGVRRAAPPRAVDIVRAFDARWAWIGPIVVDWCEPACFACGYFQGRWDDVAPWDEGVQGPTPDAVLNRRWTQSRLQKAHLVGEQFGGPNTADNYAMLCRRCHRDAPDVPDTRTMVRWIARRDPYTVTLGGEILAACSAGLVQRWAKAGGPTPDFEAVLVGRAGLHRDPTDGAEVSVATLAAVGVEAVEAALSKQPPGQLRLL